ncbi:MAG: hypothetical protein HC810_07145 [Acaryochloridaceae cyanobacterium RL_2_7]|nr:hypothetical protein [Acaryochloridaceae cyanobacterium RL_2_7]
MMAADVQAVVSDSACLIGLERIRYLEILPKLYGGIVIPEAVQSEIGFTFPWLSPKSVQNQLLVESLKGQIGWGESEAIALALELESSILILDDKKARKIAQQFNLVINRNDWPVTKGEASSGHC